MHSDGPEQDLKRLILIYIYIYGFSAGPIHHHRLHCSIESSLVDYQKLLATGMCRFKYTQHSCGHILPKFEENHNPSCELCVPVLVALKYYHDQPLHECMENARQQSPLHIPKPWRPVGPHTLDDAEEITHTYDGNYSNAGQYFAIIVSGRSIRPPRRGLQT